jgi:hypothetical protein
LLALLPRLLIDCPTCYYTLAELLPGAARNLAKVLYETFVRRAPQDKLIARQWRFMILFVIGRKKRSSSVDKQSRLLFSWRLQPIQARVKVAPESMDQARVTKADRIGRKQPLSTPFGPAQYCTPERLTGMQGECWMKFGPKLMSSTCCPDTDVSVFFASSTNATTNFRQLLYSEA